MGKFNTYTYIYFNMKFDNYQKKKKWSLIVMEIINRHYYDFVCIWNYVFYHLKKIWYSKINGEFKYRINFKIN